MARARRDPVEIAGPARHDTWSAGASTSPLEVLFGRAWDGAPALALESAPKSPSLPRRNYRRGIRRLRRCVSASIRARRAQIEQRARETSARPLSFTVRGAIRERVNGVWALALESAPKSPSLPRRNDRRGIRRVAPLGQREHSALAASLCRTLRSTSELRAVAR